MTSSFYPTLLIIFLAMVPVADLAQPVKLRFENITTAQGLSSNEITCFYQDKDGFLWVGTNYGLNRYDGKLFKTYYHEPGDSNSISGNQVVDIIQDKRGIFWIATKDGGLTRYDPYEQKKKQFHQYIFNPENKASIATNRLTSLYDYSDDYLLIGAEVYPVIFMNKKTGKFVYWQPSSKLFGPEYSIEKTQLQEINNWLHCIKKAPNNNLLLSFLSPDYIVAVSNDTVFYNFPYFKLNIERSKKTKEIIRPLSIPDFCVDGDTVWCASWAKGLFYQTLQLQNKAVRSVMGSVGNIDCEVNHVAVLNNDLLLAGTKNNGLLTVNKRTGKWQAFTNNVYEASSIISNKITAIYKDRQGAWWIGTTKGISKYDPQLWQFNTLSVIKNVQHNFITYSIFEDDKKTLRLCTSDGLYKKRGEENDFKLVPLTYKGRKLTPTIIHAYEPKKLAIGTETGLFKYNPSKEEIFAFDCNVKDEDKKRTGFPALSDFKIYQVRDITTDTINGQPILFFAVLGWGMGIYNIATHFFDDFIKRDSLPGSIKNNLSRRIIKDKSGALWIATAEGLFKWEKSSALKNQFTAYVHLPGDTTSLCNNDINDIYADEQNHLWIATNGGGLCEFDGKRFYTYRSHLQGANVMYGIYADNHQRFWMPSAAGFEVFEQDTKQFYHFEVPDESWKLQLPTKLLTTKDGSFTYAAGNLLINFKPDSIKFNHIFPKVLLTDFQQHHQSIISDLFFKQRSYDYDENFFSFYFSAPQLQQASMLIYSYKLEGLDDNWSAPVEEGKAEFPNLPPGEYTFKVKVSDGSGEWGKETSLITFTVNSPYWQQWWFYFLAAIVSALIIYLLIGSRIKQLMHIQNIRNNIANDLHDDVGSALSTISLYSEVAKIKADSKADIKEMLDKITATSQEMQENMSHIIWSLQPRNDRFDQIILRMKNYVNEVLGAKNIEVIFSADQKLDNVLLSLQQRKEFFLIFKEAINNINKYAQCKSTNISLSCTKKIIELQITDDGKGFNIMQKTMGNGMHSMKQRAKALSGKLTVKSYEDKGTLIHLSFPV